MKFDSIQQFFFLGLLLVTTGAFLWILSLYLFPVFWAMVIAVVFYPFYLRVNRYYKGRASLASFTTVMGVVAMVILPLLILGGMIVDESVTLYQGFSTDTRASNGLSLLERAEQFAVYFEPYGISQEAVVDRLRTWATSLSQVLATSLITLGQGTFSFVISFAIMLYLLFFFFRDGERLQHTLMHYIPLGDTDERRLFTRFAETARAVLKGTLTIAAIQGAIGGLAFWIVGVSNPVLWGVAMAAMALIPAVGPAIVWLPVSIILLATGSVWQGVTILLVGIFIVSLIDNFLRPVLVGRGSKMPDSITLLATIGGLATFGVSGLVIGPIVAAFFLTLWAMFGERYQKQLVKNN